MGQEIYFYDEKFRICDILNIPSEIQVYRNPDVQDTLGVHYYKKTETNVKICTCRPKEISGPCLISGF